MSYAKQHMVRYNSGKKSEEETLPILRTFFNRDIQPTEGFYNKYDFGCSKYNYELKTRTCKMNEYPTTMIGLIKCEPKTILIFRFTDAIGYIKYKEDKFKDYEIKLFTKYKEPVKHIYIPIKDLILINLKE